MPNNINRQSFFGGVAVTVIYVRPGNTKGYIRVGVKSDEEKHDFSVSESEYRDAGSPMSGDDLTQDSFEELYLADMKYRAKLKALRILSYGDNSERTLARKLSLSGISADIVRETVCEMVSLGYVNSERQIEKLILNEVSLHCHGPRKIMMKLMSKGYSKSEIQKVMDRLLESGEIDFDAAAQRLLKNKLPTDADSEDIKKLLYKNGYYVC